MTGFRVALGGAQALYGVQPDLTTLGKVIGGGMPVGAFGGRRDIMQAIAPLGPVYQAGTLSGNPVAVAAGLATLKLVQAPGFFDRLAASDAARCARAWRARRASAGVRLLRAERRRHVRPLLPRDAAGELRRSHAVRPGGLQPLLPRHARGGRLPRAVGVRGGIRLLRARHGRDRAHDRGCGEGFRRA